MRNFNRDRGSRDKRRGGFGDSRGSGRRGDFSGRPEMHKAVCAECGITCEVPFRPTGDKPVYCSNCFAGKEGGSPRRSNDRNTSRPSFGDRDRERERKMFKVVCDECGKNCEVPFSPSPDKPVYCDECFGKGNSSKKDSSSDDSLNKQFELLNDKLDKLISILTPKNNTIKLSSEKKEENKKTEVKKVDKKSLAKKEIKKVAPKDTKKDTKKPKISKAKPNKKASKK